MRAHDLGHVHWRTSTYCGNSGDCVEVADGLTAVVPVRDSTNPDGPALVFPAHAWSAFVASVNAGDLRAR